MTARQGGAAVGPLKKLFLFPTKAFHHFSTHCCKCGNATSIEKAFKVAVCKSSPETLKCLGGGGCLVHATRFSPTAILFAPNQPQACLYWFVLRSLAKFCPIEVLMTAYYGLICTHLSYSLVLWGACAKDQFLWAVKLQNEAIRILAQIIS